MRSFASSLLFLGALTLDAQTHPDAGRQRQTIENVRRFAEAHLDRAANVACVEAAFPGGANAMTIEFDGGDHPGKPSSFDASGTLLNIFLVSNDASFRYEHTASIRGKSVDVFNYSFQLNGRTQAGLIFASPETGAISRLTVRGTDAPAHLFCSSQSR